MNNEQILSSAQAADALHVHKKTLERYAREGRINGAFYAGRWHFRPSDLDEFFRQCSNQSGQPASRVN